MTKTGMKYTMLVLDSTAKMMSLKVLKQLLVFAKAGVTIVGEQPLQSPSLSDDVKEYKATLTALLTQPSVQFNADQKLTLQKIGLQEDVIINNQQAEILYVHRSTPTKEIYWLNSRSADNNSATISFRVTGKKPQLLNPVTGETKPVSYSMKNGRTELKLGFSPWDAYFIVFDQPTNQQSLSIPEWTISTAFTIPGPWTVSFQQQRGAPKTPVILDTLKSFTRFSEPGIKYFSGTATYSTTFEMKKSTSKDENITLDLGEVKNLAEIFINGKSAGIVWKKPFAINVAPLLIKGKNTIDIKVVNSWVNRLVGDAQPGAKKITFLSMPAMIRKETPLEEAGLLGPVQLIRE